MGGSIASIEFYQGHAIDASQIANRDLSMGLFQNSGSGIDRFTFGETAANGLERGTRLRLEFAAIGIYDSAVEEVSASFGISRHAGRTECFYKGSVDATDARNVLYVQQVQAPTKMDSRPEYCRLATIACAFADRPI